MKLSDIEFRAMQSGWRKWGQRNFELPQYLRMGLDIRDKDVLEIGCGSGYGAFLLNQLTPKSYLGVDMMEEQIELARRKYPQFEFIARDATDLSPLEDKSVDVVVIFGVLHHIPEWRNVLDEIARVLRKGGSLFLEEPRGLDLKAFDFLFRWGHPDSDFSLRALEEYSPTQGLRIAQRKWTPLMTMYQAILD
jgi:ubiquinone/menaquinone biosynthesis C-methylase UbiE